MRICEKILTNNTGIIENNDSIVFKNNTYYVKEKDDKNIIVDIPRANYDTSLDSISITFTHDSTLIQTGLQADSRCKNVRISPDGKFIAFSSDEFHVSGTKGYGYLSIWKRENDSITFIRKFQPNDSDIDIYTEPISDNNDRFGLALDMNNDYIIVNDDEIHLNRISGSSDPIACGVMFKKDVLIDIGLYDEKSLLAEDMDLRFRLLEKYKIGHIELPLYRYRKHLENITNDKELYEKYKRKVKTKFSKRNKS